MSRNSAYELRRRRAAESFAPAWNAALGAPKRKVTVADLDYLAMHGPIRPCLYRGRYVGSRENRAIPRFFGSSAGSTARSPT